MQTVEHRQDFPVQVLEAVPLDRLPPFDERPQACFGMDAAAAQNPRQRVLKGQQTGGSGRVRGKPEGLEALQRDARLLGQLHAEAKRAVIVRDERLVHVENHGTDHVCFPSGARRLSKLPPVSPA